MRRSTLPRNFPADDAVLPDLLDSPPGTASIAYHPRETFDDLGGWSTERVYFYGADSTWRSLEMADLGLPNSTHPGVDTYGAGALSPDGTHWAARTNDGVAVLDLKTATVETVIIPGKYTSYIDWHPDSRRLAAVRFSGLRTYRTWTVQLASPTPTRADYELPLDGFADDGTVVTYTRRGGTTNRVVHGDDGRESQTVPLPWRIARDGGAVGPTYSMLGLRRELVVVDNASSAPTARLRLRRTDEVGWPRGWWTPTTVFLTDSNHGLLIWNTTAGNIRQLVHVSPPTRADSYWSTSIAVDLAS